MKHILTSAFILFTITVMGQTKSTNPNNWKTDYHVIVSVSAPASPSVCGKNEGCVQSYSQMMDMVSAFINCMDKKCDILIDESSFEYDTYHLAQLGDLFCWGYAHHAEVIIPLF